MIFKPKLFTIIKQGLSRTLLLEDVFAGIVVGIVALPLAIAFAVASGVAPEKGIITAIVAGFIISAFGGTRVQIGGPTGAFIIIVYAILEKYGINGLLVSTIMAGIILIIFGLCRLGSTLKYIPDPIIIGFTSGIALIIFTTQIKDALGLEIAQMPSSFIDKWGIYINNITNINFTTATLTLATILIIVFSKKITKRIPGSFIAIILVTLTVNLFSLQTTTIDSFFGEIPSDIQFAIPVFELAQLPQYISPAFTIAILCAIESLLSAVIADGMTSGNHRSNTELIAQGLANITVPFFGGIPATGAIARTVTNINNGGKTPIAGIVHALTLFLILLFFGKYAKLIPMCCLAGILITVAYNMSEWRLFKNTLRSSRFDILVLLTTFFLTVIVDLAVAIEVGIVLSALLFMKRMSDFGHKIPSEVDSDLIENYSQIPEEIVIYEINGPLFFASAKHYTQTMVKMGIKGTVLVLRMRHVPFIDATGINNLRTSLEELKNNNIKIVLSGVNAVVEKELCKHNILKLIGNDNIFPSFKNAINHAKKLL